MTPSISRCQAASIRPKGEWEICGRVLAALPSAAPCRSGSQVQFSWTILFFFSVTYPLIDVYSIAGTAPTGVAPGMAVSAVAGWTWDVTIS